MEMKLGPVIKPNKRHNSSVCNKNFACASQFFVTTPIQAVKLPTTMVTRLPFSFEKNESELLNVEFWRLKKPLKTLQIRLYSVFLSVPIKHVQEKERVSEI